MSSEHPLDASPDADNSMFLVQRTRSESQGIAPASPLASSFSKRQFPGPQSPVKGKVLQVQATPVRMPSGEEFRGFLDDNKKPRGIGEMSLNSCYAFRGYFVNGMRQGNGSVLILCHGTELMIHASWIANRIDDKRPAKIEYANGDLYYGVITATTAHIADENSFPSYLKTLTVQRSGIGELCSRDREGRQERYFGTFKQNQRAWFGVQIYGSGAKYYGQWEGGIRSGLGTQLNSDGSIFEGLWKKDEPCGQGSLLLPNGSIVNGVWKGDSLPSKAKCTPNAMEPSMWSKTQVACSWGTELPNSMYWTRQERIGTRWRSLIASVASEFAAEKQKNESQESIFLRVVLQYLKGLGRISIHQSASLEILPFLKPADLKDLRPQLSSALSKYLQSAFDSRSRHPLASMCTWFQRYFMFLYGTCASNDEIGSGPNTAIFKGGYFSDSVFDELKVPSGTKPESPITCSPAKKNRLSYCFTRSHFGGCIHRSRNTKISKLHLHNAHEDIVTFLYRFKDCVRKCLGNPIADMLQSSNIDESIYRRINDKVVLSRAYPILRNLYSVVYRRDDYKFKWKLQTLKNVTLDDIGVTFARNKEEEKLFHPYDASITELSGLQQFGSLSDKLSCLRKVATEIDSHTIVNQLKEKHQSNIKKQRNAYEDVMATHRKRAGSRMPETSISRTDNESRISLDLPKSVEDRENHALGQAEESLLFASLPASPPHRQASISTSDDLKGGSSLDPACVFELNINDTLSNHTDIEGGSADELFPINLYIFIKAMLPNCVSEVQFLVDWTGNTQLFESTSDDNYRLATFQACTSYCQELDWSIRDAQRVLIPHSVIENRLVTACNNAIGTMRQRYVSIPFLFFFNFYHSCRTINNYTTKQRQDSLPPWRQHTR